MYFVTYNTNVVLKVWSFLNSVRIESQHKCEICDEIIRKEATIKNASMPNQPNTMQNVTICNNYIKKC